MKDGVPETLGHVSANGSCAWNLRAMRVAGDVDKIRLLCSRAAYTFEVGAGETGDKDIVSV